MKISEFKKLNKSDVNKFKKAVYDLSGQNPKVITIENNVYFKIFARLPKNPAFMFNGFKGFLDGLEKNLYNFGFKIKCYFSDESIYISLEEIYDNKLSEKYNFIIKKYYKIKSECYLVLINHKTKEFTIFDKPVSSIEKRKILSENKDLKEVVHVLPDNKRFILYDKDCFILVNKPSYSYVIGLSYLDFKTLKLIELEYDYRAKAIISAEESKLGSKNE